MLPSLPSLPCRRWLLILGALAGLVTATAVLPTRVAAQSPEEVRAVFLYNFAKYVEWPTATFVDAKTPITIAVVGNNAVAVALERYVKGKNANGRDVAVQKLASAAGCGDSHIVYVGDDRLAADVIAAVAGKAVLSVGNAETFVRTGGAIRLFARDGKVFCAINVKVTDAAGLKLSEKLLQASS